MIALKFITPKGLRANRRRTFCPESLEGRNLLSTVVAAPAAEVQPAVDYVPMKGTVDGTATLGAGTFDQNTGIVSVPVSYTGTGNISHLGRVTVTGSHTTKILPPYYNTSEVTGGMATITAANGDTLVLTYTGAGQLIPGASNLFTDTFHYTITGGTGRFAGASGSGVISSTDLPGGKGNQVPFVFDLDGVISSIGSEK